MSWHRPPKIVIKNRLSATEKKQKKKKKKREKEQKMNRMKLETVKELLNL